MSEGAQGRLGLGALAQELAAFGATLTGQSQALVADVEQDSRAVRPGTLFVARVGQHSDGRRFIDQAARNGAVGVLVERGQLATCSLPVVEVTDLDGALGVAAEAVHGWPSRALRVVGITGTNGKTTTASLASQALRALRHPTAQLGTLGFNCGAQTAGATLTTPPADAVSRYLSRARDEGAKTFVMEVSSHALAARRVDAIAFAVAAFSNLTQDHLDYHGSMDAYGQAKARLFTQLNPARAVINTDDAWGRHLLATTSASALSVGRNASADIRLVDETRVPTAGGEDRAMRLVVDVQGDRLEFETPVIGRHNADNWLLCVGILSALGVSLEELPRASPTIAAVPGRLERCDAAEDDVAVFVDYAHTPDALERALGALRPLTRGMLWCVFGCGGDRDASKRPLMGAVVSRLADRAVITSDNPRSELPEQIIADIAAGVPSGRKPEVVVERAQAIALALSEAQPGDLVLIAGKGHEDYQIIGDTRHHFDDREQARAGLLRRRALHEGGQS